MLKDNKTLNIQDLEEEENLWKQTLLLRPFILSRTAEDNLRYEVPEEIFYKFTGLKTKSYSRPPKVENTL